MAKVTYRVNIEKLANDLGVIIQSRELSGRQAADEIGIAPSTLSRLKDGAKPDADGLACIFMWSKLKFEDYVVRVETIEPARTKVDDEP